MITWISGNAHSLIATLSSNAITLNQNATQYFTDTKYVSVGIDYDHHHVVIHPVAKEELDKNIFTLNQLHKISVGNSYSKITNKGLLQLIQQQLTFPLNNTKFYSHFDEINRYLHIDLSQPVQKEGL